MKEQISIKIKDIELSGIINYGLHVKAWIIFAHGSGSSRLSVRNNWIANQLVERGFGTLLFDLLTPKEDTFYSNRFNISLLASRLIAATSWLTLSPHYHAQKIGYFGASTGAAAAIMAAAEADPDLPLYAIVSRGGRPDLAGLGFLNELRLPTLLIVGGHDEKVIELNQWAETKIPYATVTIVPGAGHLFEEAGALEEVKELSANWFDIHLQKVGIDDSTERLNSTRTE